MRAGPVVVVTGSTRGIGFGLAAAFAARGCRVVVTGRTAAACDDAIARLHEGGRAPDAIGHPCDVTSASSLQGLWDTSERAFGGVDCWINNAGTCNTVEAFADVPPEEIASVIDVNVRGAMLGAHVALRGMQRRGAGQIFQMEGWGSRGEYGGGMTPYCTSKRALRYFSDALAREVRGSGVRVGTLSPGMVATELLVGSYARGERENWRRMRWLFRFVIDPPEPVCAFLADGVLANPANGAHLTWMTWWRLLPRFFSPRYWRRDPVVGTALDAP